MKSSDVQLISTFGLMLGLVGLVAWYFWAWAVPCVYAEPVTHPSCPSPVIPAEAWAALLVLVALIILSSIMLVHSVSGRRS